MTAHELLTNLHHQGFNLTPLPGGLLEVRPASRLTPELREELKQRKPELLALLTQHSLFPCPDCGGAVRLDPSVDDIPTRLWTCTKCETWGATRDGAAYPVVWVSRQVVQ